MSDVSRMSAQWAVAVRSGPALPCKDSTVINDLCKGLNTLGGHVCRNASAPCRLVFKFYCTCGFDIEIHFPQQHRQYGQREFLPLGETFCWLLGRCSWASGKAVVLLLLASIVCNCQGCEYYSSVDLPLQRWRDEVCFVPFIFIFCRFAGDRL